MQQTLHIQCSRFILLLSSKMALVTVTNVKYEKRLQCRVLSHSMSNFRSIIWYAKRVCNTLCLHFSFLIGNVARSGYIVECLKLWNYIFLHHILIIGNKGLFSVSNVKRNRHTEHTLFPRIFFLSDYSGVFAITTVKWKETLQMDSFFYLFRNLW